MTRIPLTKLFHYDKFNRRIEYEVHPADFEAAKCNLLERSQTEDLGDIYYVDEDGIECKLCYYNS